MSVSFVFSSNNDTTKRMKSTHVDNNFIVCRIVNMFKLVKIFNYSCLDDGLYALAIPYMFQWFHP